MCSYFILGYIITKKGGGRFWGSACTGGRVWTRGWGGGGRLHLWGERRERAPGLRALGARRMLVPEPVPAPGSGDAASMLPPKGKPWAEAGAGPGPRRVRGPPAARKLLAISGQAGNEVFRNQGLPMNCAESLAREGGKACFQKVSVCVSVSDKGGRAAGQRGRFSQGPASRELGKTKAFSQGNEAGPDPASDVECLSSRPPSPLESKFLKEQGWVVPTEQKPSAPAPVTLKFQIPEGGGVFLPHTWRVRETEAGRETETEIRGDSG